MTTYAEAIKPLVTVRLDEANLTVGERKFMEQLIECQIDAARDIFYPVHPIKDVAVSLGLSKYQGAGFVSSLLSKNMIVMDDGLILQNIISSEEESNVL